MGKLDLTRFRGGDQDEYEHEDQSQWNGQTFQILTIEAAGYVAYECMLPLPNLEERKFFRKILSKAVKARNKEISEIVKRSKRGLGMDWDRSLSVHFTVAKRVLKEITNRRMSIKRFNKIHEEVEAEFPQTSDVFTPSLAQMEELMGTEK